MALFYQVRADVKKLHEKCPKPGCKDNPYYYRELETDTMHGRLICSRLYLVFVGHNVKQQCLHSTSAEQPNQEGYRMLNDMRRFMSGFKNMYKPAKDPTLHLLDFKNSNYGHAEVYRYPPPRDPENRTKVFCKACMREQFGPLVNYPWCSHLICPRCVSASPMSAPPSGICMLCYSYNPVIRIPHGYSIGQTSAPGLPIKLCTEVLTDIQYVHMWTNRPAGPAQETPACLNGSSQRYRLQYDPRSPHDVRKNKSQFPEWWNYPSFESGTWLKPIQIRRLLVSYFHCHKHMMSVAPDLPTSPREDPVFPMWHRRPDFRSGLPMY